MTGEHKTDTEDASADRSAPEAPTEDASASGWDEAVRRARSGRSEEGYEGAARRALRGSPWYVRFAWLIGPIAVAAIVAAFALGVLRAGGPSVRDFTIAAAAGDKSGIAAAMRSSDERVIHALADAAAKDPQVMRVIWVSILESPFTPGTHDRMLTEIAKRDANVLDKAFSENAEELLRHVTANSWKAEIWSGAIRALPLSPAVAERITGGLDAIIAEQRRKEREQRVRESAARLGADRNTLPPEARVSARRSAMCEEKYRPFIEDCYTGPWSPPSGVQYSRSLEDESRRACAEVNRGLLAECERSGD